MQPLPVASISWTPCWRIIPSRFPPVDLFERVAPKEDWPALMEVETLTNERVRLEDGQAAHVRLEDRVTGPGSSLIMAPFTHPNPCGDHFSDGTFGICYTAPTFGAALAASIRRREDFLRRTNEPPLVLQMRVLNMDLRGTFHDLRGKVANDYLDQAAAWHLSRRLREEGSYGLLVDGPLSHGAASAAIFRPPVLSNCRQERHLAYTWDGQRITKIYDYSTGQLSER